MMNKLALAAIFSFGIVLPAWLLLPQGTAGVSAAPITTASAPAAPAMSRRERMARLVAETAAARAEKTAREVLARKAATQETASR